VSITFDLRKRVNQVASTNIIGPWDVYLKAARAIASIPIGRTDEEAWLVRVLINLRRDEWRKTVVRRRHQEEAEHSTRVRTDQEAVFVARAIWRAFFELMEERAMESVRDMLRDADPLGHEPPRLEEARDRVLRAVLAAASEPPLRSSMQRKNRTPAALLVAVAVIVLCLTVLGSKIWFGGSGTLQAAAVRFEVRLADTAFSPGLREARIVGSGRVVYLHQEIIVTNDDISDSQVIDGVTPSRFGVGVTFNAAGAEKMRQSTARHVGELIAMLVDGEVIATPRLRSPISASAVISGDFTKAEAERIANGMRIR
jgi:preprotein translocase subunit SecD